MPNMSFSTNFEVTIEEDGTINYGTEDQRIIEFFETMRGNEPQLPAGTYRYTLRFTQGSVRDVGMRYTGGVRAREEYFED